MNNKDDSEMKNPLLPDESLLSEKFSRRTFMKGFAATTAAVSLSTILPANILADKGQEAVAKDAYASGNGIYINGGNVNMNDRTYTLEFTQPVKLEAVIRGEAQEEGIWRSSNKHLVSVDPNGVVRMRDGVGGYDVVVSWEKEGIVYKVNFHTAQTAGAYSIDVDAPQYRGDFMIQLAKYFGWCHYNNVMDDGSDIDDEGNILAEQGLPERVRNYYDVTGNADYVKPIEAALDMGVLCAESPDECFYPMSEMTRQDAAVILQNAFHIANSDVDYIAEFEDVDQIDPECYDAINALVANNFMRGRTPMTINPTEAITETETRLIIEAITGAVSAPVWCMPVSHRKFVRIRPYFQCPDKETTLRYRFRCVKVSDDRILGKKSQDIVMANDGEWTDWIDFIPDYTIDPFFGFQSCNWLPYDRLWYTVELEVYSTKPGKQDSGVSRYFWRIDRPAWHDFAFDQLHEKTADYPAVYRFFDNFQAAAYYIEGTTAGILYDGLMPTNTSTTLVDYVDAHCASPVDRNFKGYSFVLGHEHGDHNGAMPPAYNKGHKVYVCDRVGSFTGKSWTYRYRAEDFVDNAEATPDKEDFSGKYEDESRFIHIDEGFVFDLGNCKLETYRLPGHEDAMLILYDRVHGLLFSSDIYGVNRYWVADQFSAKGVRQDLVLSLHQQLMEEYTKGGYVVKELYTGHNRIGVGMDYLYVWEQALQDMIDWGDPAYKDDRRGNGAILARNGFSLETMNWQGFTENGKMYVAEYDGQYTGEKFRRIELDHINADGKTADVSANLYFDRNSVTALSNVSFRDAKLVGHDFRFKAGQSSEFTTLKAEEWGEDRVQELKYIIKNKFVPFEYDYDVKIAPGQETVTFTPVAMSNRIVALYVNGQLHSSRCPITVPTNATAEVYCIGPDGTHPEQPYKFTFVEDEV